MFMKTNDYHILLDKTNAQNFLRFLGRYMVSEIKNDQER